MFMNISNKIFSFLSAFVCIIFCFLLTGKFNFISCIFANFSKDTSSDNYLYGPRLQ